MRIHILLATAGVAMMMSSFLSAQDAPQKASLKTLSDLFTSEPGRLLAMPANAVVLNASNLTTSNGAATAATTYSWIKASDLPSQYQKGFWVKAQLTPTGVPTAGSISNVFWQWSLGSYVSGQVVYLCYNDGYNLDISSMGSGNSSAFNGLSANHSFWYYLYVNGSGSMLNPPVIGGRGSVTVSYTVEP